MKIYRIFLLVGAVLGLVVLSLSLTMHRQTASALYAPDFDEMPSLPSSAGPGNGNYTATAPSTPSASPMAPENTITQPVKDHHAGHPADHYKAAPPVAKSFPITAAPITMPLADYFTGFGNILFNPPNSMKAGNTERVEVRIAPGSIEMGALTNGLVGHGKPQISSIGVARFMKVKLSGDDFEIKALDSREQLISAKEFTQWSWNVTPQKAGKLSLQLLVTVRVKVGKEEGGKDLPVLERQVTVKVNPVYTCKKVWTGHWEWIAGSILGSGALGWIWRHLHRRKKHKAKK